MYGNNIWLSMMTPNIGSTLMKKVVLNQHTLIDQFICYMLAVCIGEVCYRTGEKEFKSPFNDVVGMIACRKYQKHHSQ